MNSQLFIVAALSCLTTTAGAVAQQPAPPKAAQEPQTVTEKMKGAVNSALGNPAKADVDMKRVIDKLGSLGGKPIETLSAQDARQQPTPTDAVKALLKDGGKSAEPPPGVTATDISVEGAAGKLPARVYKPDAAAGPLPVVLYFHGGGWVIADLNTYDAGPRAMAKLANAIVISVHYRQGPEHKFPAAHEDAVAAYKWVLANAEAQGGDVRRVAVMGESAGGNLAINVAIAARDQKLQLPVHEALIYPVAGVDMETESYMENAKAKPLNKAMMAWFVEQISKSPDDKNSPMIDLVGKADVKGLPATTVVTAQIDPLRTEGEQLAVKLKDAGVEVASKNYEGSTHEFFGMDAVVKDAGEAQLFVAQRLKASFAGGTLN
jgi:acetyl esterase